MRTRFGIDAFLAQAKALDRTAGDEMLGNDGFRIFGLDVAIPHRIRVNHNRWPVLALVEAAGLVDAHLACESRFPGQLLQAGVQLAFSIASAGGARRLRRANVMADKNVALEAGHGKSS